jgi:tetratricopeptide (TPR) repeat protein
MQLARGGPAGRLALAGSFSLAVVYVAAATAVFAASLLASKPTRSRLLWAARLDPLNAEYKYSLGEDALLKRQLPRESLDWFARAAALNPHRSEYWLGSALAAQSLGERDEEQALLQRALTVDPRTPEVAWKASNLYLAQGSLDAAMKQLRVVLENDPQLSGAALQICWRVRPDIDYLLSEVVPPAADPAFLDFLIAKHESQAAAKVWQAMAGEHRKVERGQVFDYIRHLVAEHEVSQAALVWQQAGELADLAGYEPSAENLIVNGDFSLEILNGGFDWMHQKTPGVNLALDPGETHTGPRSLRISFDGAGIEDAGIRQLIMLEANTSYDFAAFYKAQEMDGAGGVRLVIQDLYRETPLFASDDLVNADFWKRTGGHFTTDSDTHLAVLRITRVPAGRPIRGRLWIDGLRLVASEPSAVRIAGGSL